MLLDLRSLYEDESGAITYVCQGDIQAGAAVPTALVLRKSRRPRQLSLVAGLIEWEAGPIPRPRPQPPVVYDAGESLILYAGYEAASDVLAVLPPAVASPETWIAAAAWEAAARAVAVLVSVDYAADGAAVQAGPMDADGLAAFEPDLIARDDDDILDLIGSEDDAELSRLLAALVADRIGGRSGHLSG